MLYVIWFLAISLTSVGFLAQPAAASYHVGDGGGQDTVQPAFRVGPIRVPCPSLIPGCGGEEQPSEEPPGSTIGKLPPEKPPAEQPEPGTCEDDGDCPQGEICRAGGNTCIEAESCAGGCPAGTRCEFFLGKGIYQCNSLDCGATGLDTAFTCEDDSTVGKYSYRVYPSDGSYYDPFGWPNECRYKEAGRERIRADYNYKTCTGNEVCRNGRCVGEQLQPCSEKPPQDWDDTCDTERVTSWTWSESEQQCVAASTDTREVHPSCDPDACGEYVPSYGDPCTAGTGQCQRWGTIQCDGTTCSAEPGAASTEICDRVDNNCDGQTDENTCGPYSTCTFDPRIGLNYCDGGCDRTTYGDWIDQGCGAGSCNDGEMLQRRTSPDPACTTQKQCVADTSCIPAPPPVETNQDPTAAFTYTPANPSIGDPVSFDASGSSDADGRVVSYSWDWDSDGTYDASGRRVSLGLGQDTYTVTLQVTDNDGATDTTSRSVTVSDTSEPSTTAAVPSGWQNRPVTVAFSASDTGLGVDRTEFCIGPSCNPGQSGGSLTIDTEGVHTVRFRSVDIPGNAEPVQEATVRIDLSEPGVTVAATKTASGAEYTGGWSSEPVELGVSCTDQSGLSGCETGSGRLRLVDGPGACPGEGDRFATGTYADYDTTSGTVLTDGVYYVCAGAQDRASNVGFGGASPDARPVRVDTTSPDVTASTTSPTNDPRQTVSYTVEDRNLDDCSASGAGVSWSTSQSDDDNDGVYEGTATPQSDMSDGDHTVTVTCTDQAGNTGSDTVDLVVDTVAPSVTCDECDSPDPVKSGNDVTFDPTVSDATTSVASIEVCEDAGGSPDCTELFCSSTTSTSCSYTTPDNTFDTEDYWVRATDEAGNTASAVGPSSFTMKKWVGDACRSDAACLIGTCQEDADIGRSVCQATLIPEPGIVLQ